MLLFRCCLFALLILPLAACAAKPRPIVAEPLAAHDRQKDTAECQKLSERYGVINMEPVMAGSDNTVFPDGRRKAQLFESCMQKKGYRFAN